MRFTKYGKTYQLRIENARDLEAVLELDESLWVATSAPAGALRCDPKFTALLNTDGSGRINTYELKQGIRWLLGLLKERHGLASGRDTLPLCAVRTDTPAGQALADAARYVQESLGAAESAQISLSQVREFIAELNKQPLNGDGVLVVAAAMDAQSGQLIKDAIDCVGGEADAGGEQGIGATGLDAFAAAVKGYLDWRDAGQLPDGQERSDVMPYGSETPAVYAALEPVRAAADAFFTACRLRHYDPPSTPSLEGAKAPELDPTSVDALNGRLAALPLAKVNPEGRLPLDPEQVNPIHRAATVAFKATVLPRVLAEVPDAITEDDWHQVQNALKPFGDYAAGKKGACVEKLPPERLESYRDGTLVARVRDLIKVDAEVAQIRNGACELERLILYHQNMLRLANNFVSFSELYNVNERALFEMGSAVLDGRWFNLAFRVDDVALHQGQAKGSNIFTLYLEVTGARDERSYTVALPATSGSKGNLHVGKRGVFFDIRGREYNARITHIIENPISVREALAAPFQRLWAFVLGKIESMGATQEKALFKSTDEAIKAAGEAPPTEAPAAGKPGMPGGSAGMLMGLSVAVAAVGSAFAFITKTLSTLSGGQIFLGVVGAALVVMVPVSLIAILKLRRQDLSSLLEACGWAINARMRPSREQRRQFTRRAPYPLGAEGTPTQGWLWWVFGGLVVLTWMVLKLGGC